MTPVYCSRGPGWSGMNRHCTDFCDPMIQPKPPETSQSSTPDLTRVGCAPLGSIDVSSSATTAAAPENLNDMIAPSDRGVPNSGRAPPPKRHSTPDCG